MKLYEILGLLAKRNNKVKITFNEDESYLMYTKVEIEDYICNLSIKDLLPVIDKKIKRIVCHRGGYFEISVDIN